MRSLRFHPLLALIFLISGVSGLTYQVVWMRMLIRVFGVTVYAISVVLVVFMGGLALGSFLGGRWARGRTNLLRDYAFVELGIGAFAVLCTALMGALPDIFASAANRVGGGTLALTVVRFVLAVVVLFPPTFLMGATLPLISGYVASAKSEVGQRVGLLYGLNTFGAVLGTLASGFLLLLWVGEFGSVLISASINVLAGLLSLLVARGSREAAIGETAPDRSGAFVAILDDDEVRRVLWLYAISGFCALTYQVLWSRLLILLLGSSVYGFSSMLAVYLVGIALGSMVMARYADRIKDPLAAFGAMQVAVALLTVVSILTYVAIGQSANDENYLYSTIWRLEDFYALPVRALAIVLPTTFVLGAMFPLLTRLCTTKAGHTSTDVGRIYGWNTIGAIVGSFASGFLLIPIVGTLRSFLLASLISLILGLVLFRMSGRHGGVSRRTPVLVSVLVFVALVSFAFQDPFVAVFEARLPPGWKIVVHREDAAATVTAVEPDTGGRILYINGVHVSSKGFSGRVMVHMPLLLHKAPKKSLLIGFGAGEAFRGSVDHGVHTTVVDLVQGVVDSFGVFEEDPPKYLDDPNARVIVEDGRNFLLRTEEKFDLVLVDISPPIFSSGAVNLYALEFIELAKKRLTDDGVLAVWVPTVCFESDFWMIARNFTEAFDNYTVATISDFQGIYLFGTKTKEPVLDVDWRVIAQRIRDRKLPGFDSADRWARRLSRGRPFTRDEITKYASQFDVVTDDRPYTEFPLFRFIDGQRLYFDQSFLKVALRTLRGAEPPPDRRPLVPSSTTSTATQ